MQQGIIIIIMIIANEFSSIGTFHCIYRGHTRASYLSMRLLQRPG
jgi:hypothetical protein